MISYNNMLSILVASSLFLMSKPFLTLIELFKVISIVICIFGINTTWTIILSSSYTLVANYYIQLVSHILISALIANIITRWTFPCFCFTKNKSTYKICQLLPITLMSLFLLFQTEFQSILTTELGWMLISTFILWYWAGSYSLNRYRSTLLATAISSLTLTILINYGQFFCFTQYQLIKTIWFSFIIVLLNNGLDKSKNIIDLYPKDFPISPGLTRKTIINYTKQIIRAFLTNEFELDSIVWDDIKLCFNQASSGANFFIHIFTSGIRIDLTILYAFHKVTDDMVDNADDFVTIDYNLTTTRMFLGDIFSGRRVTWQYDVGYSINPVNMNSIDWKFYQNRLEPEQLSIFRALSRIIYYLPPKPFYELLEAYCIDASDEYRIETVDDLLKYAKYVSGSIGVLTSFIFTFKSGYFEKGFPDNMKIISRESSNLGVILQLVNIAKDISRDSIKLGRCYIPIEMLKDSGKSLQYLKVLRDPFALGENKLRQYALAILDIIDQRMANSVGSGLSKLPYSIKGSLLLMLHSYLILGSLIKMDKGYQNQLKISYKTILKLLFKCLYFQKNTQFTQL